MGISGDLAADPLRLGFMAAVCRYGMISVRRFARRKGRRTKQLGPKRNRDPSAELADSGCPQQPGQYVLLPMAKPVLKTY